MGPQADEMDPREGTQPFARPGEYREISIKSRSSRQEWSISKALMVSRKKDRVPGCSVGK